MIHRGDTFPHIQVRTIDDQTFSYSEIWQRKQFVFVVLGTSHADAEYGSVLSARASEFGDRETECVITRDDVAGLRTPSVVIADRWGEVIDIAEVSGVAGLPNADELIAWIEHLRQRCPECEGEAR
jgi:hypothetical protein